MMRVCVTGLLLAAAAPLSAQFAHGVAAGDVSDAAVILWTRADAPGALTCEVATDPEFAAGTRVIGLVADGAADQTVRLTVADLAPHTQYYYRFRDATGAVSAVGRFRTAPAQDQAAPLRFIFSGDTNYAYAPFSMMSAAAAEDPDLFLWFGDVIYGDVPAGGLGVARSLAEYRAKYRQVRGDVHARTLLQRCATLAGWDDHEVSNDYAGADPALPRDQQAAGYQAFFEYMPIRRQEAPDEPYRTYRSIRWGALVEFFFLDARQYRDVSAEAGCGGNLDPYGVVVGPLTSSAGCVDLLRAERSMLGAPQVAWLTAGLRASTARHKIIVNNVPLSFIGVSPYDRWDGYDRERRALLEYIHAERIGGVLFLTSDIHASAYNADVSRYFQRNRPDYRLLGGVPIGEAIAGPLGNETLRNTALALFDRLPAAAGPGLPTALAELLERSLERRIVELNGLSYIHTDRVNYLVIDVAADGAMALRWRGVPQAAPAEAVSTLFETPRALVTPGPACCLPVAMALAAALAIVAGRRGRRAPMLPSPVQE